MTMYVYIYKSYYTRHWKGKKSKLDLFLLKLSFICMHVFILWVYIFYFFALGLLQITINKKNGIILMGV